MSLADARARIPHIRSLAARPDADAHLLKQVLADFGRFTPMTALDGEDGLVLDVTGCAHLFGGEDALLQIVRMRAERIGLQTRAALAGTAQAARALARFGPGGVTLQGQDPAAIYRLPTAALELSPIDLQALMRAGLKSIGQVADRPRASLAARFGKAAVWRLDRVLALEDIRITPFRPRDPCVVDRMLLEPISTDDDVHRVLADLTDQVMAQLEKTGEGGRAFRASFFRVDGYVRHITVRTGRAIRDAGTLRRLFRERLAVLSAPLDPGFGFDQMRLCVMRVEPLVAAQTDLHRNPDSTADFAGLIDRLGARLGPEAVLRFVPQDTYVPERAVSLRPAGDGLAPVWAAAPEPGDTPLRPLHLFDPPQLVETPFALAPDGPPLRFRWRKVHHEVVRSEGPERIADEWWRRTEPPRDYYRVEDRQGRRMWLFRQGLYGGDIPPRWFIHGVFA